MWCIRLLYLAACVVGQNNVLTIFDNYNYQGNQLVLPVGSYPKISKEWENHTQSLKVTQGYEFIAYSSQSLQGDYMIWDKDTPDVGNLWNGQICSFIVRAISDEVLLPYKTIGRLYNASLDSKSIFFQQRGSVDESFGNVTTVLLVAGYELVLYEDSNQTGHSASYDVDTNGLSFPALSYSTRQLPTTPLTLPEDNYTAIVIGSISVVIVILAFLVFIIIRHDRRKNTSNDTNYMNVLTPIDAIVTPTTVAMPPANIPVTFNIQGVNRLDLDALELYQVIGYGSFAQVWKGTYQGQLVAVKELQSGQCTHHHIQKFIEEIALATSLDCPRIIHVLGAVWTTPFDVQAVMEFMNNGDLYGYLTRTTHKEYNWDEKRHLLLSVAEALSYLHSRAIILGDLKSRSILLSSTKDVKLAAFGLGKEELNAAMTEGVGALRWTAPEVLMQKSYSVAADIYSFGIVLSELDRHHLPYYDIKSATGAPIGDKAIVFLVANNLLQPHFTDSCPEWVKSLADSCLEYDPDRRPTSNEILSQLRAQDTGFV